MNKRNFIICCLIISILVVSSTFAGKGGNPGKPGGGKPGITENVLCVFTNNGGSNHKCKSGKNSCIGSDDCTVSVKVGKRSRTMEWTSDCSGNPTSIADGTNETITFDCQNPLQCYESDGGENYMITSTTTGYTVDNQPVSRTDSCVDSNTLNEYYCVGYVVTNTTYQCPDGCADGKCNLPQPQELVSGMNYLDYFNNQNPYPGSETYFGAYVMQPWGENLYVGFGAARPAESNGAMITRFDGQSIQFVSNIKEQGIHDMHLMENTLYIAGTDPCCGQDTPGHEWDLGNVYTYTPTQGINLHRTLPNVIHTWGLWGSNSKLYASTGSHLGGYNANLTGAIYESNDGGASWNLVTYLSFYRVYDIFGLNSKLYTLSSDGGNYLALKSSTDAGKTWTTESNSANRVRMIEFNNQVVAVDYSRGALILAGETNGYVILPFRVGSPTNVASYSDYNLLTTDGTNLYVAGENGQVYKSSDLQNWENIASVNGELISIAYWPAKNSIVFASRGLNANIWQIHVA